MEESLRVEAYQQRGRGETKFVLRIWDGPSSQAIVQVELRPDQLLHLIGGTQLDVDDGWLAPPELRSRFGKCMENESRVAPVERYRGWSDEIKEEARKWAELTRDNEDWEDFDEPRLNNRGEVIVVFRRWVDPE